MSFRLTAAGILAAMFAELKRQLAGLQRQLAELKRPLAGQWPT
jgi:hypothetical protein